MANGQNSKGGQDEVDFIASTNRNNNNNNNNNNNTNDFVNNTQMKGEGMPKCGKVEYKKKSQQIKEKDCGGGGGGDKKPKEQRTSALIAFGKKLCQRTSAAANAANAANAAAAASKSAATEAAANKKPSGSMAMPVPPAVPAVPIGTPPRQLKFAKSNSIARLLGNTYNAKKFEKEEQKRRRLANDSKFHTFHGARRRSPYLERFRLMSKEEGDAANISCTLTTSTATDATDLCGGNGRRLELISNAELPIAKRRSEEHSAKAMMRTLSRSLGKLWWKRTRSVEISSPDPEYKVSYLGNVLTSWGKGEACVEKQLNTLWRNYTQSNKPDVLMRIKVCASGLKATTRQHGLTEYWANRITYCCTPKNYPRVFCWTYRHEGRKLKHELRCHAVLCSREKIALDICETLKANLESALREFKREKLLKQNARLSLANAIYDNPSLPQRKIMLSVGGINYRPPLERSKSAPKLSAIEEAIGEEDGGEVEDTNEPEMRSCCQKDSLYPAMTLGRRRCRRGHSIRRTGKICPAQEQHTSEEQHTHGDNDKDKDKEQLATNSKQEQTKCYASDGSDSDDFDKLLKCNDYDKNSTLSTELLPYFDMQLHSNNCQSLDSLSDLTTTAEESVHLEQHTSLLPTINSDPNAHPTADFKPIEIGEEPEIDESMIKLETNAGAICSDGEDDFLEHNDNDNDNDNENDVDDEVYFRQAAILTMLHRSSMRKMAHFSLNANDSSSSSSASASASAMTQPAAARQFHHQAQSSISSNASSSTSATSCAAARATLQQDSSPNAQHKRLAGLDSDDCSISSGCETSSTATANQDDSSSPEQYQRIKQQTQQSCLVSPLFADGLLMTDLKAIYDDNDCDELNASAELLQIYQRLDTHLHSRHNSDATTNSSSSSITLKLSTSPTPSLNGHDDINLSMASSGRGKRSRKLSNSRNRRIVGGSVGSVGSVGRLESDSECSDESGYVELEDRKQNTMISSAGLPPKPTPRRSLGSIV